MRKRNSNFYCLPSGLFAVVKRTTKLSNASGKSGKYLVPSSARSFEEFFD